jgi:hypothetical protein
MVRGRSASWPRFAFAGSRSALTTLWRVDDQPTAEFMKQFYHYSLQKSLPKAEALRSAKLKLLHSGTALANPVHWAAFALNGDGLNPLPRFISWRTIAAAALVLTILVALSLLLWYRRRVQRIHGT